MSTNRSVGRLTATQEKVRFTASREKDRSAVTHKPKKTVPVSVLSLCRWPPLPHSAPLRPPASLRVPRPKGSAISSL